MHPLPLIDSFILLQSDHCQEDIISGSREDSLTNASTASLQEASQNLTLHVVRKSREMPPPAC